MIVGLVLCAATAAATAPPPTYLVERVVTTIGGARRVSVYRDGTAVLVTTVPGNPPQVRKQRLGPAELRALIQTINESYTDLQREGSMGDAPGANTVEWRLAPPDRPVFRLRLPFAGVPMLAAARLARALDDVERKIVEGGPEREDFSAWEPEQGERVELADGRVVEVLETLSGTLGLVVRVRAADALTSEFFDLAELRRQAVRRVRAQL